MTMLTQAEKRRLREQRVFSMDPDRIEMGPEWNIPVSGVSPPVEAVKITTVYSTQRENIQAKIRFGDVARSLLPHLAAAWDSGE